METAELTVSQTMTPEQTRVKQALLRFVNWLDGYGETSYDHQSYFASDLGRAAKALYYRKPALGILTVAPMIFSEAFLPSARRFFWIKQRFPIADAHYAMGFAYLHKLLNEDKYYRRAVHFLDVLLETRTSQSERHGWGYPFNWETRNGTFAANTPFITTLPYVYEAFRDVSQIDGNPKWKEIMRSIADHGLLDYADSVTSDHASCCAYNPGPPDPHGVVNASAYRAFLLIRAGADFDDARYTSTGVRNLNFVLESQNPDGSWYYSMDGQRSFVDHFHTCFVLKALAKIEAITSSPACTQAIERGVDYYLKSLFEDGMPKPFSRRPRLTVYRRELYDYAECLNLAVLLHGRFPGLDAVIPKVTDFAVWQKPDGSFRARQLLFGWDNTPMHRWAQAQYFRSLCFYLYQSSNAPGAQATIVTIR